MFYILSKRIGFCFAVTEKKCPISVFDKRQVIDVRKTIFVNFYFNFKRFETIGLNATGNSITNLTVISYYFVLTLVQ